MAANISSDEDLSKIIEENKHVVVIFQEDCSNLEADPEQIMKYVQDVAFAVVSPADVPEATSRFEIDDHELPTFIFLEENTVKDKLATGLSYQQLNGGGVTTEKLNNQIKIVFHV